MLIVEYQSQKVSVLGQVSKPGQYFLDGNDEGAHLVGQAGGVAEESAGDQAVLLRRDGASQPIDLEALFRGDALQNPVLDGDTIMFSGRRASTSTERFRGRARIAWSAT